MLDGSMGQNQNRKTFAEIGALGIYHISNAGSKSIHPKKKEIALMML